MQCQNCKENEANIRYTQIINNEKRELFLCDECEEVLENTNVSLNMPINISSFFENVLEKTELTCKKCGMHYSKFIKTGKFGCAACYDTFENKINTMLKKIHGSDKYLGRRGKRNIEANNYVQASSQKPQKRNLEAELKQAIKEERYEDAAKIRDAIKNTQ